jgi:hypothetical protein
MGPVRLAAVVGLALLAAACASGGGSGDSGPRRDRNLITGEELTQTGELTTLFDAIRRLRPTWLPGCRRHHAVRNRIRRWSNPGLQKVTQWGASARPWSAKTSSA